MRRSQNFDFLDLKIFHQVIFGELQLRQISLSFKTSCCNLKIRRLGAKLCVSFNNERSYDVLKSKSSCVLLNKNINFNKNGIIKL